MLPPQCRGVQPLSVVLPPPAVPRLPQQLPQRRHSKWRRRQQRSRGRTRQRCGLLAPTATAMRLQFKPLRRSGGPMQRQRRQRHERRRHCGPRSLHPLREPRGRVCLRCPHRHSSTQTAIELLFLGAAAALALLLVPLRFWSWPLRPSERPQLHSSPLRPLISPQQHRQKAEGVLAADRRSGAEAPSQPPMALRPLCRSAEVLRR